MRECKEPEKRNRNESAGERIERARDEKQRKKELERE